MICLSCSGVNSFPFILFLNGSPSVFNYALFHEYFSLEKKGKKNLYREYYLKQLQTLDTLSLKNSSLLPFLLALKTRTNAS